MSVAERCDEPRTFVKAIVNVGQEPEIRKGIEAIPDDALANVGITSSGIFLAGTSAFLFLEGADDPFARLGDDKAGRKWLDSLDRHSNLREARGAPAFRELRHAGNHSGRPETPPFRGGLSLAVLEGKQTRFESLWDTFADDFFEHAGITGHTVYMGGEHGHDSVLLVEAEGADWLDRLFEAPRAGRRFEALYQFTNFDLAEPSRHAITDVRDLTRLREWRSRAAVA